MTENNTINCDKFLPHPPATVWTALTDPELHARWWAAGDVKPVVGHRFTLDMGNFGSQPCEVTDVEPERLLVYRFAEGTLDTTITAATESRPARSATARSGGTPTPPTNSRCHQSRSGLSIRTADSRSPTAVRRTSNALSMLARNRCGQRATAAVVSCGSTSRTHTRSAWPSAVQGVVHSGL